MSLADYNPEEFRTTNEAAKLLGVSPKTVQLWVESGVLRAWKTAGGHRRVTLDSIREVVARREAAQAPPVGKARQLDLLVVDDEAPMRQLYEATLRTWDVPLNLRLAGDGFEGLVRIGERRPDCLITDLHMPGIDGFQMLRRLRDWPDLGGMSIVVVTGLNEDEIETAGGLPPGVTWLPKPVPFAQLRTWVGQQMQALGLAQPGVY